MSEPMYGMQRANGEWLTTEIKGALCLPVFQNAAAARRVHNRVGSLMVYRPQPLDSSTLQRLQRQKPELKFWLVDEFNPNPDLTPGRWLSPDEVVAAADTDNYALTA
ncbi:MAG: hypothetical protein ACUVR8_11930 [Acidobacteriota bacterium]